MSVLSGGFVPSPKTSSAKRRGDHPADHEHVAVGEVDQLEDPVDERVAERNEGVERAPRQPRQAELEERAPVLLEVDREPRDDEDDETQPDAGDDQRRDRSSPLRPWPDGLDVCLARHHGSCQAGEGPERPFPSWLLRLRFAR